MLTSLVVLRAGLPAPLACEGGSGLAADMQFFCFSVTIVQGIARAHRVGQENQVTVLYMVMKGKCGG